MNGRWVVLFVTFLALTGCADPREPLRHNPLTYGNVADNLVRGVTTKHDVVTQFGPPNITTRNAQNNDVWTYDKVSMQRKQGGSYWTLILLGGQKGSASDSASTTTLTISFDERGIVRDYDFYETRY